MITKVLWLKKKGGESEENEKKRGVITLIFKWISFEHGVNYGGLEICPNFNILIALHECILPVNAPKKGKKL